MIRTIRQFLTPSGPTVVYECRECGESLGPEAEECSACGAGAVSRYEIE